MSEVQYGNNAFGDLASSITNVATSITLTTGHGARFPAVTTASGNYFFATLIDASNNLEIVKCTNRSTDVLTVTRGQEGTSARAYASGDRLELRLTNQGLLDLLNKAPNAKLDTAQTYTAGQRGTVTTLTDAATVAVNFASSNNFSVTLAGNRTLGNPTNQVAGQAGSIFIVQDATGSRTLSYASDWKFPGGTAPTLSTAASAVDRLDYIVRSSTNIHAILSKDVK